MAADFAKDVGKRNRSATNKPQNSWKYIQGIRWLVTSQKNSFREIIQQLFRKEQKRVDKKLLNKMLEELDVKKSVEHIEWLTKNTPNRLSGGGQDR